MKRAHNTSLLKPISVLVILLAIAIALNMKSPSVKPGKVTTELIIVGIDYQPFEINTYDDMIEYWCMVYDVDSNLAIAISKLETAHFTSELFIENHNFGGMWYNGEFMSFATYPEGCETFVKMLKYNYIDEGLVTPVQIQEKYCPGNSNWTILVEELMKGEENGCS